MTARPPSSQQKRSIRLIVTLAPETSLYLINQAAVRQMSPTDLVEVVLETIAKDGLISAVLDD